MARTFKVSFCYPDGTAMFVGTIAAEEITPGDGPAPTPKDHGRSAGGNADGGEKMTDPQKRYLFRLLGAQGLTGKPAEEHLKQYFRVQRIADIPKQAASTYIDQLAKDKRDAAAS